MKRREFLTRCAGAALVLTIAPSLLTGCDDGTGETDDEGTGDGTGDDDSEGTGDEDTGEVTEACLDCADSVAEGPSDTHGHLICLTRADLDDGADITYTSSGGSHDHTFTITAAQLQSIAAGDIVTIESTDSHDHAWDVAMCS
ncbi:MAG: hypothetical protein ACJATT_000726 [Myxococcota bacterium]|jgi:hypothetical protein